MLLFTNVALAPQQRETCIILRYNFNGVLENDDLLYCVHR